MSGAARLVPAAKNRRTTARSALVRVAAAAVLANATWFSATAVVPALQRDWSLTAAGAAGLVVVVQVGFIVGSLAAAVLNLPDRVPPRLLMAAAALTAATANLGLLLAGGLTVGLPTRFVVGVALAGIYAPGVRSGRHPLHPRAGAGDGCGRGRVDPGLGHSEPGARRR